VANLIDASRECVTMLSIEKRTRKKLIEIIIDILRSSIAQDYEDEHVCNPSDTTDPCQTMDGRRKCLTDSQSCQSVRHCLSDVAIPRVIDS
jgi:hypothetical protein